MAQLEIYHPVPQEDEWNNTVGLKLGIPKFFGALVIECECNASAGRPSTWYEPEEYPELEVEDVVITHVEDEDGKLHKLSKKQGKLLEYMIDDSKFEEQCWDTITDMASTSQYDSWEYKYPNTNTNDWM